jgi:hypothetical protein
VLAAAAAKRLDPAVPLPECLATTSFEVPLREVGRAQNKRLSRMRRRLTGIG